MKISVFSRRALALCLVLVSLGVSAAERCTATKLEMPVTMVGTRPVVKIGINGTQVPMLVDSGAFFSFLTPAAANQLQLKLGYLPYNMRIQGLAGEVDARLTVVDRMQLEGGEISEVDFIVGGNEIGAGTMGLIGRNILSMADTEYDLANGMIRFFFPKGDCSETVFAYWAGDKPYVTLPLLRAEGRTNGRPAIRAVAQVNNEKIKVMFDTGAAGSMLSAGAARRAGVKQDQMVPAGKVRGAGQGSLDAWTAKFDRFALGGEQISNIRLTVADDMYVADAEMLLGIDFFLAHRIYVSKSQRRMYFTHNGGPVFAITAFDRAKTPTAALPAPAASTASAAPATTELDEDGQPIDAAAFARRGAGHASRLNYAAALADLDRACSLDPKQADYFARRGIVHQALRQGKEALQDFDEALKLDPTHTEALLRRAGMRAPSNAALALIDLRTLDHSLPPQAHARLQMARLFERFGQLREAIAQMDLWTAARETDIDLPAVLSLRCTLRTQLGVELDGALADCDRAVRADGKDARFRENRGLLQLKRGELDRALADFDKALELKPDAPWALYGRSIVRSQRGQTEASRADLEAARKLRPQVDAQLAKFGLPAPG